MPLTKALSQRAWQAQLSTQPLPEKPAGMGDRNGVRRKLKEHTEQTVLFPTTGDLLPSAHSWSPSFQNKTLMCLWLGRRQINKKTRLKNICCNMDEIRLFIGERKRKTFRKSRKDVFNLEFSPQDYECLSSVKWKSMVRSIQL